MGHNGPILAKKTGNDLLIDGLGHLGRDALNLGPTASLGRLSGIWS
jgi:hypothetical protein